MCEQTQIAIGKITKGDGQVEGRILNTTGWISGCIKFYVPVCLVHPVEREAARKPHLDSWICPCWPWSNGLLWKCPDVAGLTDSFAHVHSFGFFFPIRWFDFEPKPGTFRLDCGLIVWSWPFLLKTQARVLRFAVFCSAHRGHRFLMSIPLSLS